MVKRVSECFIVSEVFASSGVPESEKVINKEPAKRNNNADKKDYVWFSVYVSLFMLWMMLLFTFMFRIRDHNSVFSVDP